MNDTIVAAARLRLRPLAAADQALFRDLYSDAAVMHFIGRPLTASAANASFRATLQATRKAGGPSFFVIVEKAGGRPVGLCSIRSVEPQGRSAEMGIMLARDVRGQRYGHEALSALLAAAWRTLPIDTVWVQYRRANSGAARLFDALGFSKIDGWRPRGARSSSCVRIVQRPQRMLSIQSQKKGFPVSNVIGFIEKVGRNAALRHATRAQLLQAMRDEDLSATHREALLGADVSSIDSLIDIRGKMYCSQFPVKVPTPKKAPPKKQPAKAPPKKAPAKKPAKKAPAKKPAKKAPKR